MFGRVRASPPPLDSMEAPPSKIIKDDSFSIYEATLLKLKLGSRRPLISPASEEPDSSASEHLSSDPMNIEPTCSCGSISKHVSSDEEMTVDAEDCSSPTPSVSNSLSDCQSAATAKSVSILYLFSKFNTGQRPPTTTIYNDEAMMIENDGIDAPSFSSSSDCQSLGSAANEQGKGSRESSTTVS